MKILSTICLFLFSLSLSAQWQQTGSKVRYVNGLGIPTKDTAAGVAADSSQILIRPADSSLYIKYKRTWVKVGSGGGSVSGTTNYVPKFTSASAIGNSQIFDDGTNVGIGTASPATDLQISRAGSSTFRLTNTSNTTNVELGIATALGFVGTNTDNSFAINTNNTERVRITNTGNVGIGTTSPTNNKLQINGNVSVGTTSAAPTNGLLISGSVGIGVNGVATGFKTHINGGSLIVSDTVNTLSRIRLAVGLRSFGQPFIGSDFNSGAVYYGNRENNDVYFITNDVDRLRIMSAGRIAMGVSVPTDNGVDELQVNGSISGIGLKQAYVSKTGAYTATVDDYVIDCTSGSFTITLYAASGNTGRVLIVKNSSAGSITLDGNASETIDGSATFSLLVQYDAVQIMCDGSNWKIISKL